LFHCIQLAVVNAHILYCNKKQLPASSFRLLDFVIMLLQEIAPKPTPPSDQSSYNPVIVLSNRKHSWWNHHYELRTQGQHFPASFARLRRPANENGREEPRRKCMHCSLGIVPTVCKQCGVFLCLGRCFHEFHTLHDLNSLPDSVEKAASLSDSASE